MNLGCSMPCLVEPRAPVHKSNLHPLCLASPGAPSLDRQAAADHAYDPHPLVFINETSTDTKLARLHGASNSAGAPVDLNTHGLWVALPLVLGGAAKMAHLATFSLRCKVRVALPGIRKTCARSHVDNLRCTCVFPGNTSR